MILDTTSGGHRVILDAKEDTFRVICNGAIHATFNGRSMGWSAALAAAVKFFQGLEELTLTLPKLPE